MSFEKDGETPAWEDRDDDWSEDIRDAHPSRTGTHNEWATAMSMVGNRHSKSALVALVHFLLVERKIYRESAKRLQELLATPTLHDQVLAFHERFGQSIGVAPHVPDEKTVRFRLSLIAEEFFELLEAAGIDLEGTYPHRFILEQIAKQPKGLEDAAMKVDLAAFVDALADIDYVVEGCRITMGINGKPIADEVHASNMRKLPSYVAAKDASHGKHEEFCPKSVENPGEDLICTCSPEPVKRADGKIMKPEGWKPPDIEGELRLQGWKP